VGPMQPGRSGTRRTRGRFHIAGFGSYLEGFSDRTDKMPIKLLHKQIFSYLHSALPL
jgi:hypothetical protein